MLDSYIWWCQLAHLRLLRWHWWDLHDKPEQWCWQAEQFPVIRERSDATLTSKPLRALAWILKPVISITHTHTLDHVLVNDVTLKRSAAWPDELSCKRLCYLHDWFYCWFLKLRFQVRLKNVMDYTSINPLSFQPWCKCEGKWLICEKKSCLFSCSHCCVFSEQIAWSICPFLVGLKWAWIKCFCWGSGDILNEFLCQCFCILASLFGSWLKFSV